MAKVIHDYTTEAKKKNTINAFGAADITMPRRILREHKEKTGESISFTAFLIACYARVLEKHKYPMNTLVKSNKYYYIFDEVDVGIGGGIAEMVGNKLRLLGHNAQILCVTHQAQVASQAHQHLNVYKQTEKDNTSTHINPLDEEQRIEELSRMMGGIKITRQTRSHAREMLQQVSD